MKLPHIPVRSTNIASVAYDPEQHHLQVKFHSGNTYNYFGVAPQVNDALMSATSKGEFFDKQIKNRYRSVKEHGA